MNPVQFGDLGFNSGNFDVTDPSQVKQLQGFLQEQGLYGGKIDSMFGPKSEEAYRNYINTQRVTNDQDAYVNEEGYQPTQDSIKDTYNTIQTNNPESINSNSLLDQGMSNPNMQHIPQNAINQQQANPTGIFGKENGFGSGQGWFSKIGQGGDNFMGKFGTGEGKMAGWKPGENVAGGKGVFGKEGGFGSGQGKLSQWFGGNKNNNKPVDQTATETIAESSDVASESADTEGDGEGQSIAQWHAPQFTYSLFGDR